MSSSIVRWNIPSASELVLRYASIQPEYARPMEITSFSMDGQRSVLPNRSELVHSCLCWLNLNNDDEFRKFIVRCLNFTMQI